MNVPRLTSISKGRYVKRLTVLVPVVIFAAIGLWTVFKSSAAIPTASLEVESGSLAGGATSVADTTASGGRAVKFTATQSSDCGSGATVPSGVSTTMTLRFCDGFDGTTMDTTKWSFQSAAEANWSSNPLGTSNPGNKQLEFDQPANCTLSSGKLHMTAKRQTITASGQTFNWTSCMINTSPSYAFQYGYIEEKAQLPPVQGFWPALWTWEKPGVSIGGNGETDAFEYYSDNKSQLYLTQHNTGGGSCTYRQPFDPTTGMHTYGVDIQPSGTTWYIDGQNICHVATTSGGQTNILVDNFVFGDIPPLSTTNSGDTIIEYVRGWQ